MINKNNCEKLISLQGLRGYAFLLIFISHCSFAIDIAGENTMGALGVSVFIMLSGYLLIFNDSKKKIDHMLKNRLISKLKKFYPLHILSMIAAIPFSVYGILKGTTLLRNEILKLTANVLLIQAWIPNRDFYFSFNAVSWYLSITIFFIIITPCVIKFCYKASEHNLFLIAAAAYAVQLLIFAVFHNTELEHWVIYICPITRSIDLFIGSITALTAKRYIKNISFRTQNILFVIALCCCIIFLILSITTSKNSFYYVSAWTIPVMVIIGISGGVQPFTFNKNNI